MKWNTMLSSRCIDKHVIKQFASNANHFTNANVSVIVLTIVPFFLPKSSITSMTTGLNVAKSFNDVQIIVTTYI